MLVPINEITLIVELSVALIYLVPNRYSLLHALSREDSNDTGFAVRYMQTESVW